MWFCTSSSLFSRHFYPFYPFCKILEENDVFKHKYVYCNEHSILCGVSIVSNDSSAPPPHWSADLLYVGIRQTSPHLDHLSHQLLYVQDVGGGVDHLLWLTMIMSGFFTPSVLSEINFACTLYKLVLAPAMAMVSGGCLESVWRVSEGCLEGVWMCLEEVWGCTVGYKDL